MQRFISALSLGVACALLAACGDSTSSSTGKLTVQMTDAPFPYSQVQSVNVFVVRVDARTADADSASAANESDLSEWTTIATPNAAFDLLTLNGGKTVNLGSATLATGTYLGFRLIIDPAKSNVTLKDGTTPNVKWPSASRTGIKIVLDKAISVTKDSSVMVLDFDVGRSFVMRGNSISQNGLLFKPVIRATAQDITGGASGSVRGDSAAGPAVAGATVEVLKSGATLTDTASADVVRSGMTDASGNFTFNFLLPGTYVLRATPPATTVYKPALLNGGLTVVTGQTATGKVIVVGR